MKSNYLIITGLLLAGLFVACGRSERVPKEQIDGVVSSQEVRVLTDSDIFSAAFEQGTVLLNVLQDSLVRTFTKAASTPTPQDATLPQRLLKQLGSKTLLAQNAAQVNVYTLADTATMQNTMAKGLLEAYAYNASIGQPVKDNVQRLADTAYLIMRPIVWHQVPCGQCGGPGFDNTTWQTLSGMYATSQADSAVVPLLGAWAMVLNKKQVIKNIKE